MQMKSMKKRPGFTMIELLIVVMIIGILAVIAIPNLLQARIRSKVSRATADLRTISFALELYHTDHNGYPPNSHYQHGDDTNGLLRFNLTTPTDYIRNKDLRDPFVQPFIDPDELFYTYQNIWWYRGLYGPDYSHNPPFDWVLPDGVTRPEQFYGQWRLCSYGPDQKYSEYYPWGMVDYDPTNGTVSDGNLWFCKNLGLVDSHPGVK
jgi:prepilin-type N-terminal cleavage/methylation domain-containing protein